MLQFLSHRWIFLPVIFAGVLSGCVTYTTIDPSATPGAADTTVGHAAPRDSVTYRVETMGSEAFRPPRRTYDILHTDLQLRFDFEEERLHGTATHTLNPIVPGLDSLHFDAADMDIHAVVLTHAGWSDTLRFNYAGDGLAVFPVEPLRQFDSVQVAIDYTANPRRTEQVRGLHFVDPSGDDPSLPTQVWTLSQPEDARFWFPTWDYPNDFMTFTISMTVPDSLDTYANGVLTAQRQSGALRTDLWTLRQPHVAYLTAFAVGNFAYVADSLLRADSSVVPLGYVVEPEYAEHAHLNFGETPRMMEVFENRIGLRYPWPDYRQVAVREFTAGGMEHTTLSTMTSRLQVDPRGYLDYTGRDLIAHELVHQWFGNLLTSANWAHLSLNEGFASYFEEVYLEDAIGRAEAQEHAHSELVAYLQEAERVRRPIIWYGYDDAYDLYDRHTYQKASRVLNQLRFEIGDEAWWSAIRGYVRDNRFSNVVAEDLQQTMEQASGRDLDSFFEQWFFSPGHPELSVEHEPGGDYEIRVRQVQDTVLTPLFDFDVEFEVNYLARDPYRGRTRITSADTTIQIGTAGEVGHVVFNPGSEILADVRTQKPLAEWVDQARRGTEMIDRHDAVAVLADMEPSQAIRDALHAALFDEYDLVRLRATRALAAYVEGDAEIRRALIGRISDDQSSRVRATAVVAMADAPDDELLHSVLSDALHDSSYAVVSAAVAAYAARHPDTALDEFQHLYNLSSWDQLVELALLQAMRRLSTGERTVGYLDLQSLPDRPARVRSASARLLGDMQVLDLALSPQVDEIAQRLLSDRERGIRLATARALVGNRIEVDDAFLRERLEVEEDEAVRQALQEIVGAMESP